MPACLVVVTAAPCTIVLRKAALWSLSLLQLRESKQEWCHAPRIYNVLKTGSNGCCYRNKKLVRAESTAQAPILPARPPFVESDPAWSLSEQHGSFATWSSCAVQYSVIERTRTPAEKTRMRVPLERAEPRVLFACSNLWQERIAAGAVHQVF